MSPDLEESRPDTFFGGPDLFIEPEVESVNTRPVRRLIRPAAVGADFEVINSLASCARQISANLRTDAGIK